MKKILNLGCGDVLMDNAINTDIVPMDDRVKRLDIEDIPYFYLDNTFDEIHAEGVLQYICPKNFYKVMEELWRISKPEATIHVSHKNRNSTKCRIRMNKHEFRCFEQKDFHNHITRARFKILKYWTTRAWHLRAWWKPVHHWILEVEK